MHYKSPVNSRILIHAQFRPCHLPRCNALVFVYLLLNFMPKPRHGTAREFYYWKSIFCALLCYVGFLNNISLHTTPALYCSCLVLSKVFHCHEVKELRCVLEDQQIFSVRTAGMQKKTNNKTQYIIIDSQQANARAESEIAPRGNNKNENTFFITARIAAHPQNINILRSGNPSHGRQAGRHGTTYVCERMFERTSVCCRFSKTSSSHPAAARIFFHNFLLVEISQT